ncbi:MAG: OsmC family protein [Balneolaceae bacterium]
MSDPKTIKKAFERNRKAVELRPEIAQKIVSTNVRLVEGTTCEVVHPEWTFKADIGKSEGGNDKGPGPGILQRGALGACLAIGYIQQAAVLGVPIEHIEVNVEAKKDYSGRLGINDRPPGSQELKYNVQIESPASEDEINKVIEEADRLSPVLDDFKRAVPVTKKVTIVTEKAKN